MRYFNGLGRKFRPYGWKNEQPRTLQEGCKKIALGVRPSLTPLSMHYHADVFKFIVLEKLSYDEFRPCVHEYGGGEILLLPSARSDSSESDSESESSLVLFLREDEPRILAPAASDPIPEIIEPDPTTHVAPMD